jgi:hypothetical protein
MIEQTVNVIKVTGRVPTQAEVDRLSTIEFKNIPPGKAEVKNAFKYFLFGIGFGVGMFFFGLWVIKNFVGPGVLIFGYLGTAASPFIVGFGIISLLKLLESARKTKASKAFRWMWINAVLGRDAVDKRFGEPDYAVSIMRRIIPDGNVCSKEAFSNYLGTIRSAMGEICDKYSAKYKEEGWGETSPMKDFKITEEKELLPYLHQITGIVALRDRVSKTVNKKTEIQVPSIVELHISQYYIRAGKYWFPYDCTPAFQIEKKEETE